MKSLAGLLRETKNPPQPKQLKNRPVKSLFHLILEASQAGQQAKQMSLQSMGFGRYGKGGKVTHKSVGGKLQQVGKKSAPAKAAPTHIIEALPVTHFKPARPAKQHKPAQPAPPAHLHVQAMNPKGKLATLNKRSTLKKPGYALMKALPTITHRPAKPKRYDRRDRQPKKPIAPVAYGKTIQEMKVTKYKFDIDTKTYGDPDVGIPHGKHVEDISGEIIVTWKPGELSDPVDWEDEVIQEAEATVAENEDLHVKPGEIKWKVTKIGPNSAKLTVVDWDIKNLRENKQLSLTKLVRAVTHE